MWDLDGLIGLFFSIPRFLLACERVVFTPFCFQRSSQRLTHVLRSCFRVEMLFLLFKYFWTSFYTSARRSRPLCMDGIKRPVLRKSTLFWFWLRIQCAVDTGRLRFFHDEKHFLNTFGLVFFIILAGVVSWATFSFWKFGWWSLSSFDVCTYQLHDVVAALIYWIISS